MSIAALLSAATDSFACACCVERGYYERTFTQPDQYLLGVFGEMQFDKGELYFDISEFESIRGLSELKADYAANKAIDLNLVESFAMRTWKLNFTTGAGRTGSLVLPMPAKMLKLKVDTHDEEASEPHREVSLYKEFSFIGKVSSGSGIFRSANTRPTEYTLVFHGRGNGCDSAGDFTYWRLELNGPRAEYAMFGKMK